MIKYAVALLCLMAFLAIAQADEFRKMTGLGAYSNYQFTEEHQYGSGVQLWREGSTLLGLFSHSQGLIGDTPTGILEKVSFDPKTGRVSFTARLTLGQHGCKVHANVPSQDVFQFEGVLTDRSLSGALKHADKLHPEQAPMEEKIILKKSDDWIVTPYRNRAQWEADIKDMLRFRGPKW